ncbi:unnamed protein product [Prorocentrum cordatum]|uniref:Uncharacterized protein n=1 Tax=Prorocentrum cordatum TaxID=2364126 RepID=A0ABN9UBU6_9DINO|nr:unnamed protein product [Polarella glacialis]
MPADTARQLEFRAGRTAAARAFNALAETIGVDPVPTRAGKEHIVSLWSVLSARLPPDSLSDLRAARDKWVENHGGGDFPEPGSTGADEENVAADDPTRVASDFVDMHRVLPQTFYAGFGRKAFRAVAWFRKRMRNERPNGLPWHETTEQWARRARRVVAAMNREYDVSGLRGEFRGRLEDVVAREGDRLPK